MPHLHNAGFYHYRVARIRTVFRKPDCQDCAGTKREIRPDGANFARLLLLAFHLARSVPFSNVAPWYTCLSGAELEDEFGLPPNERPLEITRALLLH